MAIDFDRRYDTWGRGWLYDRALNLLPHLNDLRARVECATSEPALPAGGRVLSLGAGTGRLERILADAPHPPGLVVAMDPAFHMVNRLHHGTSAATRGFCRPLVGVGQEGMPFARASFDGVICFGVLSFFSDWETHLTPLPGLLRPGGKLVFAQQNLEMAIHWGLPTKKGGFLPDRMPELLHGLGLRLIAARPHLTLPITPLLTAWGVPVNALSIWAAHCLMDSWIRETGSVRAAGLLSILSGLLPLEAAISGVIVAGLATEGGASCDRPRPGPEVEDAVRRRLMAPDVAEWLHQPALARFLAFYSPMLDLGCGRSGVIRELLPAGEARFGEVDGMLRRLADPSLGVRARHRWQEANTQMLNRACSIIHRLVS